MNLSDLSGSNGMAALGAVQGVSNYTTSINTWPSGPERAERDKNIIVIEKVNNGFLIRKNELYENSDCSVARTVEELAELVRGIFALEEIRSK